jgi:hypothetical protein
MDVYTKTNSTEIPKSKRSSVYVPLHLRNEDDSTLKKYANEEASKRNSLRRPKSNRYSRNSFIEDDNVCIIYISM